MTAPASSPKGKRKLKKWEWLLLILAIVLLAGYAAWRLYYNWQYTQPITLEDACKLKNLDDCQQIEFIVSWTIKRTSVSGIPYYPSECQYQVITSEDESFAMMMDYVRNYTFHRTLTAKSHPEMEREDNLSISVNFYDNTNPPEDRGWAISWLHFYRHCADSNCIGYVHVVMPHDVPPNGVSDELSGPLYAILNQITAEKGWIDYKTK